MLKRSMVRLKHVVKVNAEVLHIRRLDDAYQDQDGDKVTKGIQRKSTFKLTQARRKCQP